MRATAPAAHDRGRPADVMQPAAPLRLVLADDHGLMREAIRRVLVSREGIDVVGEAGSGSEVVPLVEPTAPDLVLLDVTMPDLDGLACLAELRGRFPQLPVVMLSAFDSPQFVRRAAEGGARAYLVKTVPPDVLLDVVEQVAFSEPGEFVARGLGDVPTGDAAARLTDRELAVLTAVGRGLSNKQIARELWVTEQTVKFHLRNVYAKLGLADRAAAAACAYREGLVSEEQRAG